MNCLSDRLPRKQSKIRSITIMAGLRMESRRKSIWRGKKSAHLKNRLKSLKKQRGNELTPLGKSLTIKTKLDCYCFIKQAKPICRTFVLQIGFFAFQGRFVLKTVQPAGCRKRGIPYESLDRPVCYGIQCQHSPSV